MRDWLRKQLWLVPQIVVVALFLIIFYEIGGMQNEINWVIGPLVGIISILISFSLRIFDDRNRYRKAFFELRKKLENLSEESVNDRRRD